jgi:molybdopterin molybdotransferase
LIQAIQRGIESHILVITGGVSVGEHDLVQAALRTLGARIDIWRVAIKPGNHFSSAGEWLCRIRFTRKSCVGVCNLFAVCASAILKMMGAKNVDLRKVPAKLAVDLTNEGDRPHYVRGRIDNGELRAIGRQESHALLG